MRNLVTGLALATLFMVGGCGSGDPPGAADAALPPEADAGPDLTLALFDPNRVLHISIEMAPADLPALAVTALAGGAVSGFDAESGRPAVLTAAWLEVGVRALLVQVVVDDRLWVGGTTVSLDWVEATAVAATITWPPGGGEPVVAILGMIGDGTLELDQASVAPGAVISGRVVSMIYEPIF